MRQALEEGISEVLSSMVDDVGQAVSRNTSGGQVVHELLNAPWLHALLKIYECLVRFQRLTPSPCLPYASGLSHEIMTALQQTHRPSAEAVELFSLLNSPHIQALLSSHDSVARSDYGPVLPPLPDDLPEDEEAMRIVCLVKNNQPLTNAFSHLTFNKSGEERTVGGDNVGVIRSRWSSLRRLTLERLVPARRAWSREEVSASENEARLLPIHRASGRGGRGGGQFVPHYQSTGSCCLCPQSAELWKKGLNQSAPSVFSTATCTEKSKSNGDESVSPGASSDDYAYPPPPVPAFTVSLPSSPVLYTKGVPSGQSRNIPTPGRTSSCPGMNPQRPHTATSSPTKLRSTRQQGVSTLPPPERQYGCHTGLHNKRQDELHSHTLLRHPSTAQHHNGSQGLPKHYLQRGPPQFTKQSSVEELRTTVQAVASSIEQSSHDVRHLSQKMVAATEKITDDVEENALALNLLADVVDKLQGIIVAKKQESSSPPRRPKRSPPPPPPPRISSISPKSVRKPPTPYPRPISPSSTSTSSSCSTSSTSSCAGGFAASQSPKLGNGGNKWTAPSSGACQRAGGSGINGQARFNNGMVARAPSQGRDCNNTGCLKTRRRKKKKNK